jgi:hypothetical protein
MNPYGTVNGKVYTNNAAGFTVMLPDGYQIVNTADTIKDYELKTFNARKSLYRDADAMKLSLQVEDDPGFIAYMHPDDKPNGLNNEFSCDLVKLNGARFDAITIASESIKSLNKVSAKYKISEPVPMKIDGVDSAYFTNNYTLDSIDYYEQYYIFTNNDYMIAICKTAMDPYAMDIMTAAFNTLKITPSAPVAASPSSTDISGTLNGNTYTNDAAGFILAYPDSYTVYSRDQINALMAASIEKIKSLYKDPDLIEKALEQNVPVSMASMHEAGYMVGFNSNVSVMVQSVSVSGNIVDFANTLLKVVQKQSDSLKFGKAASAKLGGHEAASATITQKLNGINVYQKIYFVSSNEYLVVITLSAANNNELKSLDKIVNTIQFTA